MRVCDYIAEYLHQNGIKFIHGLMGGGAAGLNDGFIKHPHLEYVCYHHEQSAGHAAIGESKFTGKLAVVNPTTGCGGTNCITSVLNAWQDSVPILFISGNVRKESCTNYIQSTQGLNLRKYGTQEHNIIDTVSSITKYSKFIDNPNDIDYYLHVAIEEALNGRPGPVWLDIPGDVQLAEIEDRPIKKINEFRKTYNRTFSEDSRNKIVEMFQQAERPLVLAGYGIRQANAVDSFVRFVERFYIPFVSTYGARDYTEGRHSLSIGTVGIKGSRAGNFALQNCDLLLILGSSLGASVIGYDPKQFNPCKKIIVDCDYEELQKNIIPIQHKLYYDLRNFFKVMLNE
jgi:acetolactate synthase-1/2/3 large subunit